MPEMCDRGHRIRNDVGLVLYLAGGWRSYRGIGEEFGWAVGDNGKCKTASRNVRALEQAGLPIEWAFPPDERNGGGQRMRIPPAWVACTPWLRRYIIRKTPLNALAYRRSLHK